MTVFFIDTAHNIIDYIETISKILKPGGVWINLGNDLYSEENGISTITYEPCCEKTCLWIFRPGLTQTGLYSNKRWLEA